MNPSILTAFLIATSSMACGMINKAGSSGPAPSNQPGAGPTAAPSGAASSHAASEGYANGLGDGATEVAEWHKAITKACGHDVAVKWDWASFKGHALDDGSVDAGRFCTDDTLNTIRYFCAAQERAKYRDVAVAVTTVTCRYKACTELPPSSWDRNDGILDPGFEYALADNGTNLQKSFCDKSQFAGTWDLDRWFRDPHYPKVKQPGSVQRD